MSYTVSLSSLNRSYSIPTGGETDWRAGISNYLRDLAGVVNGITGGGSVATAVYNVKTYGATGNGVTDDTVAVKLALAAAVSGGVVYFPTGSYVISSTLNVLGGNVTILGDGFQSRINQVGAFSTTPLIKFNSNGCSVRSIILDGGFNTGTGPLILADGSNYLFVSSAILTNAKGWGIDTTGGTTPSTGLTTVAVDFAANQGGDVRADGTWNSAFGALNTSVRAYGAAGDGVVDDTAAFNRAVAARKAAGGGTITVPRGTYRITSQIVLSGTKWVSESDIDITTADPTAVASYNATNAAASNNAPVIHLIGEPGAVIWCDFAPSGDTAAICVATRTGLYQPATRIENLTITSRASMSSGGTITPGVDTSVAPSTNINGIFAASTRVDVRNCVFYGVKRGLVLCAAYWSVADMLVASWVDRGFVLPGHNAAQLNRILGNYAATSAVEVTGQGFKINGLWTEQCATSLYIPNADSFVLENFYIEAVTSGLTDYQIKIGDGGSYSGSGVYWGQVRGGTLASVYGKTMHLQGAQVDFYSTRFYDQATDGQRALGGSGCVCAFYHCNIPFQVATGNRIDFTNHPATFVSASVSASGIAQGRSFSTTLTATGVAGGSEAGIGAFSPPAGWTYTAYVSGDNTIIAVITNVSGATQDFPTRTIQCSWSRGTVY